MKRVFRRSVRRSEDGVNIASDVNIAVSGGGSMVSSSTSSVISQTGRGGRKEPESAEGESAEGESTDQKEE